MLEAIVSPLNIAAVSVLGQAAAFYWFLTDHKIYKGTLYICTGGMSLP